MPKLNPQPPIDYEYWNIVINVLESRFEPSVSSFIRDRTRIINSHGNIWEKATGNIQLAIENVLLDESGAVWLPKGKMTESSDWVVERVEAGAHLWRGDVLATSTGAP